jgi:lipopolysaccharide/colanic/teichoic acid biosynthesis glycosyltransferase
MSTMDDGPVVRQATRGDARVTRVGRWLRRSSIDEMPQLINVVLGHMSLVGPRPHALAHDDYYEKVIATYAFRQHVKPGITGWAQVNGLRGETPTIELMERRVEHDLWYVANWSFWLDIRTLFMTVGALLRHRDAY